jgi:hypothetical protein
VSGTDAGPALRLRVTVGDTWEPVSLDAALDESVREVKVRALKAENIPLAEADLYEVKFRGGRVGDESVSLRRLGVPDGGALIVLARRRRPVR